MARRGETLELAVLGLLHHSPMHGYELRKQVNGVLGWSRLLSYGSLYPALKKMLKAGWIAEHVTAPEPGAVSRRQRIVYELTPAGDARFTKLMADVGPSAWEDEDFNMRFAFFSRTDSEVRLRILEGRRSRLQERLDRARTSRGPAGADRYVTELQRHAIESVEREVRWLTDLIAAERSGPEPAPQAPRSPARTGRTKARPPATRKSARAADAGPRSGEIQSQPTTSTSRE